VAGFHELGDLFAGRHDPKAHHHIQLLPHRHVRGVYLVRRERRYRRRAD
jgi:hypothetical protein